jgi:hypothetical protein
VFSSKLKLDFFVLDLVSLFFFSSFVKIFSEVLNNAVIVMAVFFPKLAQLFRASLNYLKEGFSDFKPLL